MSQETQDLFTEWLQVFSSRTSLLKVKLSPTFSLAAESNSRSFLLMHVETTYTGLFWHWRKQKTWWFSVKLCSSERLVSMIFFVVDVYLWRTSGIMISFKSASQHWIQKYAYHVCVFRFDWRMTRGVHVLMQITATGRWGFLSTWLPFTSRSVFASREVSPSSLKTSATE